MIRIPAASPSHHVSQMEKYCSSEAKPPHVRVVTPIVALTVGLSNPARIANLKTSGGDSKARRPCANLWTNHAPTKPSSVLPTAMLPAVNHVPDVVTFTQKAPIRIVGHAEKPSSRK